MFSFQRPILIGSVLALLIISLSDPPLFAEMRVRIGASVATNEAVGYTAELFLNNLSIGVDSFSSPAVIESGLYSVDLYGISVCGYLGTHDGLAIGLESGGWGTEKNEITGLSDYTGFWTGVFVRYRYVLGSTGRGFTFDVDICNFPFPPLPDLTAISVADAAATEIPLSGYFLRFALGLQL